MRETAADAFIQASPMWLHECAHRHKGTDGGHHCEKIQVLSPSPLPNCSSGHPGDLLFETCVASCMTAVHELHKTHPNAGVSSAVSSPQCRYCRCRRCAFCRAHGGESPTVGFAINVHEELSIMQRQWANIAGNSVGVSPYIALSGNAQVHANLSSPHWALPPGVGLNPEVIEKGRCKPTILQGILSNMRWLERTIAPQYQVVLSSRTRMFAPLHAHNLEAAMNQNPLRNAGHDPMHLPQNGHWPAFNSTRFADVILRRGGRFVGGGHEALVFDRFTVRAMLAFLEALLPSEPELFSCHEDGQPRCCCLEEFVLHTLALHVGGRFGKLLAADGVAPSYAVAIQVLREPGFWWPPVYGVPLMAS